MRLPKLNPFEDDLMFGGCLEEVLLDLRESLRVGHERHGDGFAETGIVGFAEHCWRKAKDQRRLVVDDVEVGHSLEGVSRDLATYVLLERVYLKMLERKGLNGS